MQSYRHFAPTSPRRGSVLLLSLIALFCVAVEVGAKWAFPRVSHIRERIEIEAHGARSISGIETRPSVLLVGNSLVERGVSVPALQQSLSEYQLRRFVISDTSFVDWYFGLKRLFAEGARPQVVVLGLSTRNLALVRFEGDLSANVLLRTRDVPSVGRLLRDDNTELSNLYAANLSSFFGNRTQVRKWLLTSMLPDLDLLASRLRSTSAAEPSADKLQILFEEHLQELKDVCARNGAVLVLVIPPSLYHNEDEIRAAQLAGSAIGVPVLSPIHPGALGPGYYRDGVHLTDQGALLFTAQLSSALRSTLSPFLRASLN